MPALDKDKQICSTELITKQSVISRRHAYRFAADGSAEHRCSSCRQWLPADGRHFPRSTSSHCLGLGGMCHACNREHAAAWRSQNPARATAQRMRRYERDLATPGAFTADDRQALLDRYGRRCLACHQHACVVGRLVCDHVIPSGRPGSSHDAGNRQPLCAACNRHKASKDTDYRSAALQPPPVEDSGADFWFSPADELDELTPRRYQQVCRRYHDLVTSIAGSIA